MKKAKKVILQIITILVLLAMAGCANGAGDIEIDSSDENGSSGGIMQSLPVKIVIAAVATIILPIPFIPFFPLITTLLVFLG